MELEVGPRIIVTFENGFFITETACWAVITAIFLIVLAFIFTRNLKEIPKGKQIVAEFIVEWFYNWTKNVMGKNNLSYAPFVGTLFTYLLVCNALGLLGWRAPSADVNFTFAMSIMVFFIIQISSIKRRGIIGYGKHFAEPFVFMIPIKMLEEITFPISLAFRLFGNILAGVIIVELFMHMMHFVSEKVLGHFGEIVPLFQAVTPLPVNAFFDIFEPVLQAFVFTMLTMSFISRAITIHHDH